MADVFKEAVMARNSLTVREVKAIRKIYNEWAREARELAKVAIRTNLDEAKAATELYYQLRNASRQISAEINGEVSGSINSIGDIMVRTNARWLSRLGFTEESLVLKFSPAKDIAIRSIMTGNLYQKEIPLSDKIWSITESNLKDIYTIISKGIATNQSVNDIAIQLEKYLKPGSNLGWSINTVDGKLYQIHNRQADWRAKRLARTTLQHAYQKTLVELTKDNPFVSGYLWHAAGNHPCELCLDRDGLFYTAETLPLDHPNGQCDFEVVINQEKAEKDMAGFYENPILYPDIQRFTSGLEYID